MEIAKVKVTGTRAETIEALDIPEGIVGATVSFEFGPEWAGLTKNVVFVGAKDVEILNIQDSVYLPPEAVSAPNIIVKVGIVGVDTNEKMVIPTLWADLGTVKPGAPVGMGYEPTLPIWAQLMGMIGDLRGLNTVDKSNLVAAINEAMSKSGTAGGYYTPVVTQPTTNTMKIAFVPSVVTMPAGEPVTITLPGSDSGQNGNGLSTELKTALINYYTHVMPNFDDANGLSYINAILTALGAETREEPSEPEEPDTPVEPDEPDTPEVTLTSISAVYSGGDVAVGTAVTDLTGIVVTAHYSNGTSETVTGYTLSGTIAEGSNTVTVSYGGKTATFTVTGVAESGGDDSGDTTVEIPADATRLAYIESTGTQYIDTEYQPAAKDTIELTMETAYAGTSARVDWFGASDGTNLFMAGTNLQYVYFGRTGNNSRSSTPLASVWFGETGDHVKLELQSSISYHANPGFDCSSLGCVANGVRVTWSTNLQEVQCVYNDIQANMYLFASNNNGALQRQSSMKLYECIFYDVNGAEVHHYVPVKDANNVVCLYDTIDKRYLYNAGTGDFVGGEAA